MKGLVVLVPSFKHSEKKVSEEIDDSILRTESNDEPPTVNKSVSVLRAGWVDRILNLYSPADKPAGKIPLIRGV